MCVVCACVGVGGGYTCIYVSKSIYRWISIYIYMVDPGANSISGSTRNDHNAQGVNLNFLFERRTRPRRSAVFLKVLCAPK